MVGGESAVIARRTVLAAGLATPFVARAQGSARVVIVGGGFGGASAARALRQYAPTLDVTLIEANETFVACPFSNLVIAGTRPIESQQFGYRALAAEGIRVVHAEAIGIDAKRAILSNGDVVPYDRLILSPGIDIAWGALPGYDEAASTRMPHAWKAGVQTILLRKQLEAMPDGGVYALTVPEAPYRCPPGPYERASQVAHYFKQAKPKSKVLILDANPDVTSKAGLFKKFWNDNYKDIIEYRPNHKVTAVDTENSSIRFDIQEPVKADVMNVLPAMRAGAIAVQTGLATANNRWCGIHYKTFESIAAKDIHILGDAILAAPAMPKSAHMANSHAKVAASAIVAQLSGLDINDTPFLTNTCYSYVNDKLVVHVASVHQYNAEEKTYKTVAGSGGLSSEANSLEGTYAWNWAQNIWADSLL